MSNRINSVYKSLGIAVAIFLAVAMSVPAFGAGSITWLQIGGILVIFALGLAIVVVPLCIVFYKLFSAEKADRRDERRAWERREEQIISLVKQKYRLLRQPDETEETNYYDTVPLVAPSDFYGRPMLNQARPASDYGLVVEADYRIMEEAQGGAIVLADRY